MAAAPILVTGGNRGLGYQVVKTLAKNNPDTVILMGTRDLSAGQKAIEKIKSEDPALASANIEAVQIDVQSDESIKQAALTVKEKYGKLQTLVNNAGVLGDDAAYVLGVNYFGVEKVTNAFLSLIPKDGTGRIVIVSSEISTWTHNVFKGELRDTLDHPEKLQISDVDALAAQFVKAAAANDEAVLAKYPPGSETFGHYGISKALVSTYGRILARELKDQQITVVLVCPGYCQTELNGNSGPRSAEEGGKSIAFATKVVPEDSGKFFNNENKSVPMAQQMPADFFDPK